MEFKRPQVIGFTPEVPYVMPFAFHQLSSLIKQKRADFSEALRGICDIVESKSKL